MPRKEDAGAGRQPGGAGKERKTRRHLTLQWARVPSAAIKVIRTMHKLNSESCDIFFKLFDSQVQPILLCTSEVWGMNILWNNRECPFVCVVEFFLMHRDRRQVPWFTVKLVDTHCPSMLLWDLWSTGYASRRCHIRGFHAKHRRWWTRGRVLRTVGIRNERLYYLNMVLNKTTHQSEWLIKWSFLDRWDRGRSIILFRSGSRTSQAVMDMYCINL